jgi:hypothetical protein
MRRHPALRTTISEGPEGPVQVVQPGVDQPLPLIDLRAIPEPEREAEARRLATEHVRVPFDLARDPMLRAHLLRLGEAEHVLLLTVHHIACDAWTYGVLYRELAALYEGFLTGKPAQLPELPIEYADFAVWQRRRMESDELKRQLAYWRRQLEGAPPLLELPSDRPRPAVMGHDGREVMQVIPEQLRAELTALSR